MIVVDTTVLVYALGSDHPLREAFSQVDGLRHLDPADDDFLARTLAA